MFTSHVIFLNSGREIGLWRVSPAEQFAASNNDWLWQSSIYVRPDENFCHISPRVKHAQSKAIPLLGFKRKPELFGYFWSIFGYDFAWIILNHIELLCCVLQQFILFGPAQFSVLASISKWRTPRSPPTFFWAMAYWSHFSKSIAAAVALFLRMMVLENLAST